MMSMPHPMMPMANHDEEAEQRFVRDFKLYLTNALEPLGRKQADRVDGGEQSNDRVRQTYDRLFECQGVRTWANLRRTSQEMLWRAVYRTVDRELDRINGQAEDTPALGSLTADPNFVLPSYMAAGDIHLAPGAYHREGEGVEQGALIDLGNFVYMMGTNGGLMEDGRGQALMQHLFDRFPDFSPKRVLDMGCGPGNSSIPAAMAYADAEVHGLDVGLGMLRYAQARASVLGYPIHFQQGVVEHTPYANESFDLVYSCALLHETSEASLQAVMAECFRILRPGGVMAHLEVPHRYETIDLWTKMRAEIEHDFNNEPNWRPAISADYGALLDACGFEDIATGFQSATSAAARNQTGFSDRSDGPFKSWFVASARKPA